MQICYNRTNIPIGHRVRLIGKTQASLTPGLFMLPRPTFAEVPLKIPPLKGDNVGNTSVNILQMRLGRRRNWVRPRKFSGPETNGGDHRWVSPPHTPAANVGQVHWNLAEALTHGVVSKYQYTEPLHTEKA